MVYIILNFKRKLNKGEIMRKLLIALSAIVVLLFVLLLFSNTSLNVYQNRVNETALSFCAEEILSTNSPQTKAENIKMLLTFSDLSEKHKKILINSARNNAPGLAEVANMMQYFEYNRRTLNLLIEKIENLETVTAIKTVDNVTANEVAQMMIKDIFKGGVKFNKEFGDGNNYVIRYYCSNFCIDVCNDTTIRYMSNISHAGSEDLLLNWLLEDENAYVDTIELKSGIEYRKVAGNTISAIVYVDVTTNRVIAAEITLKS